MDEFEKITVIGEKSDKRPAPIAEPTSAVEQLSISEATAEKENEKTAEELSSDGSAAALPPLPEKPENAALRFREEAKKVYDPDAPSLVNNIFDFVELFVITLVSVLLLVCFVFRYSVVDGKSMQNTLQDGEKLIISDLFYTPRRGDVVVFEDYGIGNYLKKPLVKRVIGVAGDTVEIRTGRKLVDGSYTMRATIYVNGEKIVEDYVYIDPGAADPSKNQVITVPEGEIFVLGDHRNDSTDSRYFGCVSTDAVLGKVLLRVYPLDKFGAVD